VFALTGFWHGASWSFLFWGLFHGFFLILERLGLDKLLSKLWTPLQHLYVLLVVIVGWVFFRVESISDAFYYVKLLVYSPVSDKIWMSYFDLQFMIVFVIAVLGSMNFFPWAKIQFEHFVKSDLIKTLSAYVYAVSLLIVFLVSSIVLLSDTYNPFIYFRF
jgi:alginate O-acetyltransferase complex protein AlgI